MSRGIFAKSRRARWRRPPYGSTLIEDALSFQVVPTVAAELRAASVSWAPDPPVPSATWESQAVWFTHDSILLSKP